MQITNFEKWVIVFAIIGMLVTLVGIPLGLIWLVSHVRFV